MKVIIIMFVLFILGCSNFNIQNINCEDTTECPVNSYCHISNGNCVEITSCDEIINGKYCYNNTLCSDDNGLHCECLEGYKGVLCDKCDNGYERNISNKCVLPVCNPNPCAININENKTKCTDSDFDGVYECFCNDNYFDNGDGTCVLK